MQCPACAHDSVRNGSVYNGFQLVECMGCSLVFTEQRSFSADQYDDIYSGVTAYTMMIDAAERTHKGELGRADLWWFKRKALSWVEAKHKAGRILDIGSGPGTFLMIAQRMGYEVQGVEPAGPASEIANKFGVPTYCGVVEDFAETTSDKFDVITSFEVLEHVPDPLSLLVATRKLLNEAGMLIISTPNRDDPYCLDQQIVPVMPPVHINFFNRKSFNALLQRAGFQMARSFTLPIPTSSVRNIHGANGWLLRLPYLAVRKLAGKADGTTLLLQAKPAR